MPKNQKYQSITASQVQKGHGTMIVHVGGTFSSVRMVPYVETYRESTGLIPTPVERLQDEFNDSHPIEQPQ